ncbi:class I SAM-dependent DNA methyltransferase [Actinocorallia lasiicapitis]
MGDHTRRVAAAYDGVAELYAERFGNALEDEPFARAMLGAFAELTRGPVADVGCGPGHVTGLLRTLGVDAFGLDASAEMVELARRAWPELTFVRGELGALPVADGALGGLLARYSVIHTPVAEVPAIFTEFARVLAPGRHTLVSFFAIEGDGPLEFAHQVAPAFAWPAGIVGRMLGEAGLAPVARFVGEGGGRPGFLDGHILARRE